MAAMDEDDYQAQSDADTLQKHAEIVGDPDRHAAAHKQLQKKFGDAAAAMKHSKKAMHGKVKKGLAKAFPDSTPFDKAGKGGGTPFDEAGGSRDGD